MFICYKFSIKIFISTKSRLANDFKNLSSKALLVIGKTPLTEELYNKFIVEEYDKFYSVNIRNRFKADAKHIIVTNYQIGELYGISKK